MSRPPLMPVLVFLCALPACAQTGTAPVLARQPYAAYPEAARKAHVTGEAVVDFSVDPAGKTIRVHAVSGPAMLTSALLNEIRGWRFVTPLPRDSEKDFVADYTYSIVEPEKQVPPTGSNPASDDADSAPTPIAAVSGLVHSVNNRQEIDVTPYVRNETKPAEGATPPS